MLRGLRRKDTPHIDNHHKGRKDQKRNRRVLHEVHVSEDETLDADEAEDERVRAEAAAADLDRIHAVVQLPMLPCNMYQAASDARHRPERRHAYPTKEP